MIESSGAEVRLVASDPDLGSRPDDDEEPDTVSVVVARDAMREGGRPEPIVREVPRAARADWDERFWRSLH